MTQILCKEWNCHRYPIATGSLIKGSKELIKGLGTGASTIVKEGGEYVIRKAVVSKLDEIRNIAKIMDESLYK